MINLNKERSTQSINEEDEEGDYYNEPENVY